MRESNTILVRLGLQTLIQTTGEDHSKELKDRNQNIWLQKKDDSTLNLITVSIMEKTENYRDFLKQPNSTSMISGGFGRNQSHMAKSPSERQEFSSFLTTPSSCVLVPMIESKCTIDLVSTIA